MKGEIRHKFLIYKLGWTHAGFIGEYQSSAALSVMRVHVRLIRRSRHIERSFDFETTTSLGFTKVTYIKKIIGWGFCDIRNNQGRGKCYQPSQRPRLITFTGILISMSAAFTYAHMPVRTAEIWKNMFVFSWKHFSGIDMTDKFFALYCCLCSSISFNLFIV